MSFKITVLDHNFLHLIGYPESVKQLLSYQVKSYNSWKKKVSFETHSAIDFDSQTTYTGLLNLLVSKHPEVEVDDKRTFTITDLQEPELSVAPRDYQYDYFLTGLKKTRMIVNSATGSGKTTIMAMFISAFRNANILIIAPDKSLLGQLHSSLSELLPTVKIGRVSSEYKELSESITIGLPLTLSKLPTGELQKYKVLLVDEAHKAASDTYQGLILRVNAEYRYGFTATPTGRSDNKDLLVEGLLGESVELMERKELESKGFVAKTSIDFYRGWFEGDFINLEDLLIVNNSKRNNLILKIVKNNKKSTILILVRKIEHGKILQDMIGNESIFLSGDFSTDEREQARKDISSGKYRVLIATKIFGTGLDIPSLELGINAKGGKAEIDTIQGLGRVARPWNEVAKKWIDIYDEYNSILEEHSKERLKYYKDQGVNINYIGFTSGKEKRLKEL